MKKPHLLKLFLGLSLLANVILIFFISRNNEIDKQTLEQIAFRGIQSNLVQLEGAVKYQSDTGWANPSHVTEKLDDVIEGISLAFEIGNLSGALDTEKENLLWELHHYLIKFKGDSGFPNVTLSETERNDFINLGNHLRLSGWGMNLGYGSGWHDFEQKTRKLLS